MKKIITFILILLAFNVNAKFIQTINAKYQTQYGWSKYYTVEATFLTGLELNQAAQTYKYDSYATYCVIWWSSEQYTIIKLVYISCGYEAHPSCISYYSSLDGKDQDGDKWFICLMRYCY